MVKRLWIRKAVSACVLFTVVTASSMVVLAIPERTAAELTVTGKSVNGESPTVLVNGEVARSGRSIFSSSTISTPAGSKAVLSIGKLARIELDESSAMDLVFDEKGVNGELTSGRLTVLGSTGTVRIRTNDGKVTSLNTGESVDASGQGQRARQTGGNNDWWIWLLIAGGAAAAVIIAVTQSNNNNVVSPNR